MARNWRSVNPANYRKKENMTDAEARKKLFDQLDAEAKRYGADLNDDGILEAQELTA